MYRFVATAALVLALSSLGCGSKSSEPAPPDQTKAGQPKAPPPKPGRPPAQPDTGGPLVAFPFSQTFQVDRSAALEKYQGQTLEISGVIRAITADGSNTMVTLYSSGDDYRPDSVTLKFLFGPKHKAALKAAESDDENRTIKCRAGKDPELPLVTIRGKCRGFAGKGIAGNANHLVFDDCEFVAPPKGIDTKRAVGVPSEAARLDLGKFLEDYGDAANGDQKHRGQAVEVTGYLKTQTGNVSEVLHIKGESTRETTYLWTAINPHDIHKTLYLKEDTKITVKGVVGRSVREGPNKKPKYVVLESVEILRIDK